MDVQRLLAGIILCHFTLREVHSAPVFECKEKVDLVVMVDTSASVIENNPDNWPKLIDFLSRIASHLPIGQDKVRFGAVSFSTQVRVVLRLHESFDNNYVNHTIHHNIPYLNGNTNTAGALRVTKDLFGSQYQDRFTPANRLKKVALLVTDGLSNIDSQHTIEEARKLKQLGVRVFTVGVTNQVNLQELHEISSDPYEYHHFMVADFQRLSFIIDQLLSRLCQPKIPPAAKCDKKIDLSFVVDSSGSIKDSNKYNKNNEDNWVLVQNFIKEIILRLDVGPNATRVGLIVYSHRAYVNFALNTYYAKQSLVNAVSNMSYIGSYTNTSGALKVTREELYLKDKGDRPDVRNVAIVMTDGESTVNKTRTIPEAKLCKDAGIRILAVGLTNNKQEKELRGIASKPVVDHYFNSTKISEAVNLRDRIVLHLCDDPCSDLKPGETCDLEKLRCPRAAESLEWEQHRQRLLVGHNLVRIPNVPGPAECRRLCLNDDHCRSIDYVSSIQECALSHETRTSQPNDFAVDSYVDYHEWKCVGGVTYNPKLPTKQPPKPPGVVRPRPPVRTAAASAATSSLLTILTAMLALCIHTHMYQNTV